VSGTSGQKRASALDGIRGVALACPIVVHLGIVDADRGLWLAIGMFFTLSSFLVTTLALREVDDTGRLRLGNFWMRRLRRLLPASLLVLALIVVIAWAIDWPGLAAVKGDVLSALVWGSNWEQLNGGGYWDGFSPSLTHHFWSLSFEEQVYVFFPIVIAALVALRRRRAGRGSFASHVMMASLVILTGSWIFLWTVDDPISLYLHSVPRLGEIALGMFAAALSHRWSRRALSDRAAGSIILITMVAAAPLWIWAPGDTVDGVRLGITLGAPLAAVVIAMLWRYPGSLPSRFFSLRVPAWLGRRSYGVYLLHLPIIDFMAFELGEEHLPRPWMVVAVVATIVGAGMMFRFFEEPLRVGRWVKSDRAMVLSLVVGVALVAVTTLALVRDEQPLLAIPPTQSPPPSPPPSSTQGPPPSAAPGDTTTTVAVDPTTPSSNGLDVLVVGDSTAWVTSGAVRDALSPIGYETSLVHMVGCPFGGDARLKTSYMGGAVTVREIGDEPGCDQWWKEYLPQWLAATRPDVVVIIGGYGLAWEIDPNGDDRWCVLGDGTNRCEPWARARIEATSGMLERLAPDAIVVWTTTGHVDPWGPLDIDPRAIDVLNTLIIDEAKRNQADVIDLGSWLDDNLDLTVDGTHLGPEGVAAVTPWLSERLVPLVPVS
jgi:peptidoglycan/LPS O-acetylase OafA/YrhL